MSKMVFLVLGILFLSFSNAEKFQGAVNQENGLAFLAKFCFDVNHEDDVRATVGRFQLSLASSINTSDMGDTYVMMYDDQIESWPAIYENVQNLECTEIRERAKNFAAGDAHKVNWVKQSDDSYTFVARGFGIGQNIRPRWWYFALVNCGTDLQDVTFEAHAWQTQSSNWEMEFGVNEQGLNTLNLVFFFFYFVFMVIHTYGTRKLGKQLEFTHPLVRLFYIIVLLQSLVVTSRMLHYGIFAQNGWGVPELQKFAEVAEIFVRVGFLVILMLLAKGWTINPGQIEGKKWILLFSSLFLFADIAILFYTYAIKNPAETEIPTGLKFLLYLMLVLWFIWSFWFAATIYTSWSKEDNPVKKGLFNKLAVIYFPWIFGLPFITVMQFALDPWVREKVVASLSLLLSTAGYSFLSYLLWPTRAEEYFTISAPDTMTSGVDNYEQL